MASRATVVRRLKPLPIEAVVRGYLIGSGYKDYQATGAVCGIPLPAGLPMAAPLPEPLFTPATKAALGDHDENISFAECEKLLGTELATKVRTLAIRVYSEGAAYARSRGIIIADTKFEFGLDDAGELYLIDEVMTPDSSRFWPAAEYRAGIEPPELRQAVRPGLPGDARLEQEGARTPLAPGCHPADNGEVSAGAGAADRLSRRRAQARLSSRRSPSAPAGSSPSAPRPAGPHRCQWRGLPGTCP